MTPARSDSFVWLNEAMTTAVLVPFFCGETGDFGATSHLT